MSSTPTGISHFSEVVMILMGYLLVILNPIATAFITELILLEGSAFYINMPFPSSQGTMFIPSPWILYTVVYAGISLVLIWLSIFFVKQTEK
jgi:hypothetical protein